MFNGKRHADVEVLAAEERIRTRQGLWDTDPVNEDEVADEAARAIEHREPPWGIIGVDDDPHEHRGTRVSFSLILPALFLAGISVALGVGGESLVALAEQASSDLLDTTEYVRSVIGG